MRIRVKLDSRDCLQIPCRSRRGACSARRGAPLEPRRRYDPCDDMGETRMDNRILDDLAKVAASALGGVAGVRQEVEARLRQQFERILANMDVVSREEFEVVRALAVKARTEQEALAARLAALEERIKDSAETGS